MTDRASNAERCRRRQRPSCTSAGPRTRSGGRNPAVSRSGPGRPRSMTGSTSSPEPVPATRTTSRMAQRGLERPRSAAHRSCGGCRTGQRSPGGLHHVGGGRLDDLGAGPLRRCRGEDGDHIPMGERAAPSGQLLEAGADPVGVDTSRLDGSTPAHHPGQIAQVEPQIGGPLLPLAHQRIHGAVTVLVRTGGMEGSSGPSRYVPVGDASGQVFVHGRRSLREESAQCRVDTDHVPHPGAGNVPRGTEAVAQLHAESCVIHGLGRMGVGEHPPPVQGRPPPVHAPGHVGHHQMGVEMRIEGPAGPVHELAGHQSGGRQLGDLSGPGAADSEPGPLEVARGLGHGGEVAVADLGGDLARGEQVEEAHRLRCAEGEVEAGHTPGPHRCAQRASRPGVAAPEHLGEDRRNHRAAHAQVGEAGTEPGAGGLTGHPGPLGPAGDQVVDVVVVAAGSDHVDREHVRRCAAGLAGDLAGERGSSLPSGRPGAKGPGPEQVDNLLLGGCRFPARQTQH